MQYFFFAGIILSAFLSLVLFSRREKSISDYLLESWFSFSVGALYSYTLVYTQQYLLYPFLIVFGMALPLASSSILYVYVKYKIDPLFLFNKMDLLHFIPLIIVSLLFIDFYFLPEDGKLLLEAIDPNPIDNPKYTKIGFEAYCSKISIRNIIIRQIHWESLSTEYKL